MTEFAAEAVTVRTLDGRELEVLISGPTDGFPVVFHSGTPSGPVHFPAYTKAAAGNGLRLVTYGRPGYGRSTAQPGRRVSDAAADTAAVLDHLGLEDFLTMGHSGGGPHALACAALLPSRCRAVASVAGVAPWDAEGLDVMAGMGPENVEEFGVAVQGPAALEPWLEAASAPLHTIEGAAVAEELGGLVPEIDKQALTGEFADVMAAALRKGVERGVAGWRDDDLAFVRNWGFDVGSITVPVAIWQGAQDLMVPFAHGQWLAAHVAGAAAHLFDEHGHLSLTVDHMPAILADLATHVG
ncbi:MAG: alpha/beta fold hydrolase [Sporichthyaceae bacterium]